MTKQEALNKIEELKDYIKELDKEVGYKDDKLFLLSAEEYERYKDVIPECKCYWWLRSPGYDDRGAAFVNGSGYVNDVGTRVNVAYVGIRPALKYVNIESEIIKSKLDSDTFIWKERRWVIIDKEKQIAIAELPITFDQFDYYNNDYKYSYIRKWLLNFAKGGDNNED